MVYLLPTDYASFGLPADTTDDWITIASTMIDSYCHRTSLSPTQYEERLYISTRTQSVRLSYLPLVAIPPSSSPLISVQARYTYPRRGEIIEPAYAQVAWAFGLPGMWSTVNAMDVDVVLNTGELTLRSNLFRLPYNEIDVVYTAGLATIPATIQVACAQIVKNAQSTPGLNVKSNQIDSMRLEYFSNSLIDPQVAALLRPYVATTLG